MLCQHVPKPNYAIVQIVSKTNWITILDWFKFANLRKGLFWRSLDTKGTYYYHTPAPPLCCVNICPSQIMQSYKFCRKQTGIPFLTGSNLQIWKKGLFWKSRDTKGTYYYHKPPPPFLCCVNTCPSQIMQSYKLCKKQSGILFLTDLSGKIDRWDFVLQLSWELFCDGKVSTEGILLPLTPLCARARLIIRWFC